MAGSNNYVYPIDKNCERYDNEFAFHMWYEFLHSQMNID